MRHAARAFWRFSVGQRAQARELASHSSLLSCLRDVCVCMHTNTRTYAEIHAVRVRVCVLDAVDLTFETVWQREWVGRGKESGCVRQDYKR